MKIITPKFLKYFISNRRLPYKALNEGKQALNLKECKKFLFMYKGEHFFEICSIIILFKFIKVNIKDLREKRGPKNEVLKIGRLVSLKVRFYT